jgi:predicted glutamine amidotransferase
VVDAFEYTFTELKKMMKSNNIKEAAYLNMVVTNGIFIVAARYVTDPNEEALTLYHSKGSKYVCEEGVCSMLAPEDQDQAVLIVSEKLTDTSKDWTEVPKNHFIIVDQSLEIKTQPIRA